ncbi:hypothetical protein [Oceanobacillus manasiensis]|uniref:hypothetical protein n=1 Tax=Oceanobacillus manasiensis TaxID=586413 RepID=UPI0005A672CC|nr:hypothetical protein [Oceanobacillus manasiensis]
MRRPIFEVDKTSKTDLQVLSQVGNRTTVELTGLELKRRLRKKRSSSYVESIKKLDAHSVTNNQAQIDELKEAIRSEFPELKPYQFPIGIIARCYLGKTYEVHTLDVIFDIVKHYKKGESLPQQLEKGRSLALHPSYEFIEVYNDVIRAVTIHGDVSVIEE